MTKQSLDARIAQALNGSGKTSSDDLQTLRADIVQAIADADQIAGAERNKSLEPSTSPQDAEAAAQRVTFAELQRERYQIALPRIRERLREVLQREYAERWQVDHDKVATQRNASAENFQRLPELFAQIVTIFRDAADIDKEVDRVNAVAPDGAVRLATVEKFARNLAAFTRTVPSLAAVTLLHDWKTSEQIWPPKKPPLASYFAPAPAHPGARWHEHLGQAQEQQRRDTARVANYYNAQHDARQQAENREAAERAAALRRGGE
jgi:hypothetical protein